MLAFQFNSCRDDDGSFDNKLYNTTAKMSTTFLKPDVSEVEQIITVSIAQPVSYDITVNYKADASLVDTYNQLYADSASILPKEFFTMENPSVVITAGSVKSPDLVVKFMNLGQLNRDSVYVLPVTIDNANLDILNSARTTYYVFRGASLINVVADIEENHLKMPASWPNPSVVTNLKEVTLEALIRARNYDRLISTVMGIEGYFLIRIGDAGHPSNQIQIATNSGNFPDADSNKGLPTNKWIHIALTYNSSNGAMILYVDGKKQAEAVKRLGDISFASSDFYIGKSYDDQRFLAGEISECRIWNVVRTAEEIAANPYSVAKDAPGLVAYWKCDEGEGNTINDRTGNGNNLTAANVPLKWTQVKLPE